TPSASDQAGICPRRRAPQGALFFCPERGSTRTSPALHWHPSRTWRVWMQEVGNEPAETGHSRPDRAEVWSAYWGQGPLHSLPTSFPDNYQGQIRDFWVGMLSGLGTGHRMLDIGTGNGALPRMALELRGVNCPQVDAIDAAAVAP